MATREPRGERLRAAERSLTNSFSVLKLLVVTSNAESIRKIMSALKPGVIVGVGVVLIVTVEGVVVGVAVGVAVGVVVGVGVTST